MPENNKPKRVKKCTHVLPEDLKYISNDGTLYSVCRKCRTVFVKSLEQPFSTEKSTEEIVAQLAEAVDNE